MVKVTAIDGVNYFKIASTTVPLHSDITSWLNSLEIPNYDGYEFDFWDLPNGDIKDITGNANVYSRYSKSGGDTKGVFTYVNGDGDITVSVPDIPDELTGVATVDISMSKNFNEVTYDWYDVMEFFADNKSGEKIKLDITTTDNIITFTDEDVSTHLWYRIGLFGENGVRVGQKAWDDGFYPTNIKFTLEDGTVYEYEVTIMGS